MRIRSIIYCTFNKLAYSLILFNKWVNVQLRPMCSMDNFKKMNFYFYSIALCMLLNACAYNKGEAPVPVNRSVSYALDVKPIIITHCFKCHSDTATNPNRSGSVFFNDFSVVQTLALKQSNADPNYTVLIARLRYIESPGMPFRESPLSDSLIQVIQDWVLIGAPNN